MLMFILLVVLSSSSAHTQSWSLLITSNKPPARAHHSTVYDHVANRIVIFGGSVTGGNVSDIWSLNLDSLVWQQLIPASELKPSARFTHNAIFDTARNQMVIWAGQGAPGVFYNDVWAFNFSTQTWEELWPQGNTESAPVPRYGTTAQFDPVARQLINVSGIDASGTRHPDTWTFHIDSLQWSDQSTFPHPPKRCLHTSDFAENRRRLFLYGGQNETPYLEDLWSLNVDTFEWEQLTPNNRPDGRHFSSIVYDGSGHLHVFGGKTSNTATQDGAKNDLWRFSLDTNTWEQLLPPEPLPAIRYGHTAIFARSRKSMIIVGGIVGNLRFNDVWEFQLATATHVPLSDIPTEFSLSQNYPNPFNPTTNIEFRIADFGFVTLKIYDMLGRNIATLMNESLPPGVYRRTWDGSGYPSGLYYYRLQTSNFLDTKTMTLLK
ncbi:MAG TPA: kelch repeat-containing protein [Bacteroidota bacterium]